MLNNLSPHLSICIPTYNRAHSIEPAIKSILNQDYKHYEVVVSDNASTDNTKDVVLSFDDPRIKYFRYEELVSMYENHNRCVEKAESEWIVFLHSDDLLVSLENVVDILRNNNFQMGIYMQRIVDLYTDRTSLVCVGDNKKTRILKECDYIDIFRKFNGMSPSGTLYSKKILENLGGFNTSHILADWEILLEASAKGFKVYELERGFAEKKFHKNQATISASKTGEGHKAKMQCIRNSLSKLSDKAYFTQEYINNCSPPEIMLLYRYLVYLDFNADALLLKKKAILESKFDYFSIDLVHTNLERLVGLNLYFSLLEIAKNIQYKILHT